MIFPYDCELRVHVHDGEEVALLVVRVARPHVEELLAFASFEVLDENRLVGRESRTGRNGRRQRSEQQKGAFHGCSPFSG